MNNELIVFFKVALEAKVAKDVKNFPKVVLQVMFFNPAVDRKHSVFNFVGVTLKSSVFNSKS